MSVHAACGSRPLRKTSRGPFFFSRPSRESRAAAQSTPRTRMPARPRRAVIAGTGREPPCAFFLANTFPPRRYAPPSIPYPYNLTPNPCYLTALYRNPAFLYIPYK
jgi:hypothetical protein